MKQLEESLCQELRIEKLGVKILKSALRQYNLPHTGKKLELAERLALFFHNQETNPGVPPLATDYIRDDHDLSESEGEDDDDDDEDEDLEDEDGAQAAGS